MWYCAANKNPSFGNRPTKKKMSDDYGKQVRNAVLRDSIMDPQGKIYVKDVLLLFTMV
jgi:hypothetical protein